ncbi:hypothetical protein [Microbacterium flavum]|uniref:Glycosyltransferase n=1 Tax=Microbacterium flavum TaxID=415216 RepID=A0ABS5XUJ1_9MICO|nr:hypothetical protein [Microbacterium flavum]MBT8797601.1 hypothetical protein [Microbacterium flavum]
MSAASFSSSDGAPRVTVLSRPPQHKVRYVDQLVGDDSAGAAPREVEYSFTPTLRRSDAADVVFLPHPDAVLGGGRTPAREQERHARRFVRTLRRRGIALVSLRDSHRPHHPRDVSRAMQTLDHATTTYVRVDFPGDDGDDARVVRIPLSHLRNRFAGYPRREMVAGRLVIAASEYLDAAYEATLKVFGIARLEEWTLHVVGQVPGRLVASFDRSAAAHPGRIVLRAGMLSDAARIEEITQAELVIISAPGAADSIETMMLALSLDRPVLVQQTAMSRSLATAVGPGWVRTHEGLLTAVKLENAIADLRADPPSGSPVLTAMDPNQVAASYQAAFVEAAALGHTRRRRPAKSERA